MAASTRDTVPGFGEMVRTAREQKGWSRDKLAEVAGCSRSGIADIELGQRAVSLRLAAALAGALGIVAFLHDPATPIGPSSV